MTEKKTSLPPDWTPSAKVEIRQVFVAWGDAKQPEPKIDEISEIYEKWLCVSRRLEELTSAQPQEPPKFAEALLILCSGCGERAEAIQGDLCEQFSRDCTQMSIARARRRYWSRVLVSLGPQFGRMIARAVRWAAILSLVKKLFMAG